MPVSAEDTADFLNFFDQLFDSVNSSALQPDHGNELRAAVTAKSKHIVFWSEAVQVLQSIKFLSNRGETVPTSIKNWERTIRGFRHLWKKLKSNPHDLKYLCPRNLNQDPLENFFGCIRSHGARNVNPTCYAFTNSFKSLIVNNFVSPHSPGANCETDDAALLDVLKSFIEDGSTTIDKSPVENDVEDVELSEEIDIEHDNTIVNTYSYIAGFIARKILKIVNNCQTCRQELITSDLHRKTPSFQQCSTDQILYFYLALSSPLFFQN